MAFKIVVGYDGSQSAKAALSEGIDLAGKLAGSVVVAYAYGGPKSCSGAPLTPRSKLKVLGKRLLRDALAQANDAGVRTEPVLVNDSPAPGLLSVTHEQGAEMIVVGTHGESPISGMLPGVTADKLVHTATRPVLVVPAPESAFVVKTAVVRATTRIDSRPEAARLALLVRRSLLADARLRRTAAADPGLDHGLRVGSQCRCWEAANRDGTVRSRKLKAHGACCARCRRPVRAHVGRRCCPGCRKQRAYGWGRRPSCRSQRNPRRGKTLGGKGRATAILVSSSSSLNRPLPAAVRRRPVKEQTDGARG